MRWQCICNEASIFCTPATGAACAICCLVESRAFHFYSLPIYIFHCLSLYAPMAKTRRASKHTHNLSEIHYVCRLGDLYRYCIMSRRAAWMRWRFHQDHEVHCVVDGLTECRLSVSRAALCEFLMHDAVGGCHTSRCVWTAEVDHLQLDLVCRFDAALWPRYGWIVR